ncbi:hypothetical protein [Methyloversatilis sp.]|uniref:DUF3024 domain-containing protein n=1 Tax=Methyloversatilis sp. TaxID=2569862 RepID=UPI0035B01C82
MNMHALSPLRIAPVTGGRVVVAETELLRRRVLRALAARERYRYVHPELLDTDDGWIIRSPCCSRNVDPEGGVIDIARLQQADASWVLYAADHLLGGWVKHSRSNSLDGLLDTIVRDPHRVFWP